MGNGPVGRRKVATVMSRWVSVAFGFLVAVTGGLLETRHHIEFGVVALVVGLAGGLASAGARLHDGADDA